ALAQFRTMRSGGQFTPIGVDRPTIVFPGFDGGAEWGGAAVDPARGVLYVNSNDVPWCTQMAKNVISDEAGRGVVVYQEQGSPCHGLNRQGAPPEFPSLVSVGSRLSAQEIEATIKGGRGRMPGFPQLSEDDRTALIEFLTTGKSAQAPSKGREVESGG